MLKGINSAGSGPIWQKFELVRDFMPVLITCKFEEDLIKGGDIVFSHYKLMGDFCCHGNQSFDPICPKTLSAFLPP